MMDLGILSAPWRVALAGLVCSLFLGTGRADDSIFYVVRASGLKCVIENVQSYLEVNDDLVLISIDACPDVSADPFASVVRNSVPEIPEITFRDGPIDRLLALTKNQLNCIRSVNVPPAAGVAIYYPERCEIVFDPN